MSEKWIRFEVIESVDQENKPCFDIVKDMGEGHYEYIAEVYEKDLANIMATAPDMYEVLNQVHDFLKVRMLIDSEILSEIRIALAKARGES